MKKIFSLAIIYLTAIFTMMLMSSGMSHAAIPIPCDSPNLSAKQQLQCGACGAAGQTTCEPSTSSTSVNNTVKTAINLLSVVAGVAAVIMLMVGGFRYVTSGGNAESIKSARSTITYAIIGLIIVAIAQVIVRFVLITTNDSAKGTGASNATGTGSSVHVGAGAGERPN
jgi:hypothetical protein